MLKKKQLWSPISTLLHRNTRTQSIPSLFRNLNLNLNLQSQSSVSSFNFPSSSHHSIQQQPRVPKSLLLQFPSKPFCAQAFEKRGTCTCWSCDSVIQSSLCLVCDSCRCIQPVDHSVDYFQIFGLEKRYDIEESNLEGMYKDWQKKLHPDLVHSKTEREKEYAAEQSARVIDAYRTLTNPLSRATYLMKLQGVHVDEEQTVLDPTLLAEVMETREAVEEASDSQELKQIQSQVEDKLKSCSDSFLAAFESKDTEAALDSIRRMTYYIRAIEEIVKKL